MPIKKQTVNWTFNGKEITCLQDCEANALAFIYKISLLDGTGRYYIGRKTLLKPKHTKGVNKGLSKGEYSWKSYCGSSKELLKILKDEKPSYKKEILKFTFTKAETTYEEAKNIICSGALTDPLCFNYWFKGTMYSKHLEKYT